MKWDGKWHITLEVFRDLGLAFAAVLVLICVILFDPIFQGLAISLMAGEVASLLISHMAVPVLYYMAYSRKPAVAPTAGEGSGAEVPASAQT